MSTREVVVEAVLGLLQTINRLVQAGDDPKEAEEALLAQAEENKRLLDKLRFPSG